MRALRDFRHSVRRVSEQDAHWFKQQLMRRTYPVRVRGTEILIRCPVHTDSNPSCGVSTTKNGAWNCFSCKAGGGWNALAEKLGMDKLSFRDDEESKQGLEAQATRKLARSLKRSGLDEARLAEVKVKKRNEETGELEDFGLDSAKPITRPWPVDEDWRGISGQVLHDLGCLHLIDLALAANRIALPMRNVDGMLQGYQCRALDPDVEPRYIPMAADRERYKELPAKKSIFLIDEAAREDWSVVVLVEGPFDALNLYANGIPALSILGTSNWTRMKAATLLAMNVDFVYVLMDNDSAGKRAQKRIVSDLEKLGIACKSLGLGKASDPGELGPKGLNSLLMKAQRPGFKPLKSANAKRAGKR